MMKKGRVSQIHSVSRHGVQKFTGNKDPLVKNLTKEIFDNERISLNYFT